MRFLKGLLITIGVLLIVTLVLSLVAILFKACGWLPEVTDWINTNIFEKIGLTFYGKL